MTNIPFQTYPFAANKPDGSPAPIARDMPTRLADIINVKDYGATGDGHTDDSFALQAAIAAAYGTFGSPHGDRTPGPYGNKIVYFPPGHYIIGTTLQLPATCGGYLLGSGSNATTIENTTPGATVVKTDGWTYSAVEGITFKGIDGGTAIGFDWRKSVSQVIVGNQLCLFLNCAFEGCNIGVSCGLIDGSAQSDTSLFVNNRFTNNTYGIVTYGNALLQTVLGGTFINNGYGVAIFNGSAPILRGLNFSGSSNYDISIASGGNDNHHIAGCVSTSTNFLFANGLHFIVMENCRHTAASNGYFVRTENIPVVMKGCYSSKGQLYLGPGGVRVRVMNCVFDRSDWLGHDGGNLWSPGTGPTTGGYLELENLTVGPTPTQILRQRISTPNGGVTLTTENYVVA
jgi:hypothetical protein